MPRYIDAEAFDCFDCSVYDGRLTEDAVQGMQTVLNLIDKAEIVDAVKVVRCKNCEHYTPAGENKHYGCCHYWQYYCDAPEVNEDDFCSSAERREK